MQLDIIFFFNSLLLGVGLSMDAFSVSLANGLSEPCMKKGKLLATAGIFSGFQFIMPMIGWVCVSTVAQRFKSFEKFIPWIALALLGFIGGKMLVEGIRNRGNTECRVAVGIGALLLQGLATSIDALSVGFTVADYPFLKALLTGLIIGAVTFALCIVGLLLGKRASGALSGKAGILGGAILIIIGLEIFIKSLL